MRKKKELEEKIARKQKVTSHERFHLPAFLSVCFALVQSGAVFWRQQTSWLLAGRHERHVHGVDVADVSFSQTSTNSLKPFIRYILVPHPALSLPPEPYPFCTMMFRVAMVVNACVGRGKTTAVVRHVVRRGQNGVQRRCCSNRGR